MMNKNELRPRIFWADSFYLVDVGEFAKSLSWNAYCWYMLSILVYASLMLTLNSSKIIFLNNLMLLRTIMQFTCRIAIQLYLSHVLSPPIHLSASELRHHIYSLLNSSPTGSQILLNYNLTPSTIASNILPSLKPSLFPTRDTYASDYAIAAMATLFQSPITVYALSDSNIPLKHTYLPYTPSEYASHLHRPTMHITVLHSLSHFQLLLPYNLPLHPLPSKPLDLPRLPPINTTPPNFPVIINTPPSFNICSSCPFSPSLPPSTSFCPASCHPLCPNHYTAFRPTALRHISNPYTSELITLETIIPHTPICILAGTIRATPSPSSIPITPSHHSDVPTSHPLLKLIHSPLTPNCYIAPINIPEPTPHLHLFLLASELIPPYESLRIRPPPLNPRPKLYRALRGHPYDLVRIKSPRFSRGPLAYLSLLLPNPPSTPPSRASTHID